MAIHEIREAIDSLKLLLKNPPNYEPIRIDEVVGILVNALEAIEREFTKEETK